HARSRTARARARPAAWCLLPAASSSKCLRQRLRGRINGAFDRRGVMRQRDEPRLELRRRRVDAALEQGAPEPCEGGGVASRGGGEVTNRPLAEEHRHQAWLGGDLDGQPSRSL